MEREGKQRELLDFTDGILSKTQKQWLGEQGANPFEKINAAVNHWIEAFEAGSPQFNDALNSATIDAATTESSLDLVLKRSIYTGVYLGLAVMAERIGVSKIINTLNQYKDQTSDAFFTAIREGLGVPEGYTLAEPSRKIVSSNEKDPLAYRIERRLSLTPQGKLMALGEAVGNAHPGLTVPGVQRGVLAAYHAMNQGKEFFFRR